MMTRWKAFLIHLTISVVIAIGIATLMLSLWYTPALFAAAGGQGLLVLLLAVDVTLGPLITLIIFNVNKSRKMLTFDFSVIGIVQFAALIYGMSVMYQARPVFVVFVQDSFSIATANEVSDSDLAKSSIPEFKTLSMSGPVYAYAELPSNANEKADVEMAAALGKGLQTFPQYFKPYTANGPLVGKQVKALSELKKLNEGREAEIQKLIEHSGKAELELGFLPLRGMGSNMVVLLEKSNGNVLQVLDMKPF
jgi:hypothetical protein